MHLPRLVKDQKGALPLFILLAGIGLVAFFGVVSVAPFKNNVLSTLFPKGLTFAAGPGITVGALDLKATFNSIAIELKFTDDDNRNATAKLAFKKRSDPDTAWKEGLDLWRVDPADNRTAGSSPTVIPPIDSFGRAFYGSALLLEAGTCYDIKITVSDPDGGGATINTGNAASLPTGSTLTGTCENKKDQTRTENILPANQLTATHYVNGATGNDALTAVQAANKSTPWKTLKKAITTAPSGAIVEVAPGFYVQPTSIRTTPITLKAEYPAVDDNRNVINPDKHSIIIAGDQTTGKIGMSCPLNATDCPTEYKGVWEEVTNLPAPGLGCHPTDPDPMKCDDLVATGSAMPEDINGDPAKSTKWPKADLPAKVWKWVSTTERPVPVIEPYAMGYSATKYGEPQQIAYWDIREPSTGVPRQPIDSPEGFVEKLLTNKSYNYGFSSFNSSKDLYLRLPPNARKADGTVTSDPNDLYITLGGNGNSSFSRFGLALYVGDSRVTGFETRMFYMGLFLNPNTLSTTPTALGDTTIDHNLLIGRVGVNISAHQPSGRYRTDTVVQYNLIKNSNMRSDDQVNNPTIPWNSVKNVMTNADGTTYRRPTSATGWEDASRIVGMAEGHGVDGYDGGGMNTVVRYNTIDGTFDGIAPANNADDKSFTRYAGYNLDAHDNLFQNLPDDPLEPGAWSINFKFWNNTTNRTMNFISLDPTQFGPGYIFRNTAYRVGSSGVAKTNDGKIPNGSNFFKHSSASHVAEKLFVVNNTFWTDLSADATQNANGGDQAAGTSGKVSDRFFMRNNLFRSSLYTFKVAHTSKDAAQAWDEDYNYFYTADNAKGFTINSIAKRTLAEYRLNLETLTGRPTHFGNGKHTNLADTAGNFNTSPDGWLIVNDTNKTVATHPTLAQGKLIDMGTPVPNISDTYNGCAPDIGNSDLAGPGTCGSDPVTPSATPAPSISPPPPPPTKQGDTDADGDVDIFDYNNLLTDFNKTGTGLKGDFDNNSRVDIFDYNLLLTNFGS